MALGGITAMLFGTRLAYSTGLVLHKLDLRSMFFATMSIIILFVLAYLTNPNETSFRTFLTEQSFRQHLTRLDDAAHDDHPVREDSGVHYSLSHRTPKPPSSVNSHPPSQHFEFAKRASVSLRTPKHIFRSFGLFTIAAVCPPARAPPRDPAAPLVADAWFLGAFGRWWRGGALPPWCTQNAANAKDAERCASGVLDLKALDSLDGYDGLLALPPPSRAGIVANGSAKEASPKAHAANANAHARPSERALQRTGSSASRSTTPPPLPKSASLPLHAPRVPVSPPRPDRSPNDRPGPAPSPAANPAQAQLNAHAHAHVPGDAALFDQSPALADLLRQIGASRAALADLRAQLGTSRAQAAAAHAALETELAATRERKRAEDAARGDTKAQTKRLDDQKRAADARRREVEKRLKGAQARSAGASRWIERLEEEQGALRVQVRADRAAGEGVRRAGALQVQALAAEVEGRRAEVEGAEDGVARLNARARALEERIEREEERVRRAREQAELRKQDRSFLTLHVVHDDPATFTRDVDALGPAFHPPSRSSSGSGSDERRASPPPLSLAGLPHLAGLHDPHLNATAEPVPAPTRFAPFSEDLDSAGGPGLSPRTSALIPASLISQLDGAGADEPARSFQSERDDVLQRDWRSAPALPVEPPAPSATQGQGQFALGHPQQQQQGQGAQFSSSPTSITHPAFDAIDQEDPFEIRPPPAPRRPLAHALDLQRAFFQPNRNRTAPAANALSQPQPQPPLARARSHEEPEDAAAHRRWFSASHDRDRDREHEHEHERRGLNPEAAVFRLPRPAPPPPPSLHWASAFAPSPAERAALGSGHGSLERLPTLSEVAVPAQGQAQPPIGTGRALVPGLGWLGLGLGAPRRKPKFSPWDEGGEGASVSE